MVLMGFHTFSGWARGIPLIYSLHHCFGKIDERAPRNAVLERDRHTVVATAANACHQWHLSKQFHAEFFGKVLATVFAENIVFLIGV